MISIKSTADMAATLDTLLDPDLRRLLTDRSDQLLEYDGYDLGELVHTNKHDRAIVFISAAIGQGVTAGPAIIALGAKLGLNPKHVAIVLHQEAGANVERHRWRRDADGDYSMLP